MAPVDGSRSSTMLPLLEIDEQDLRDVPTVIATPALRHDGQNGGRIDELAQRSLLDRSKSRARSQCHYDNLSSYFVIPNLTPPAALAKKTGRRRNVTEARGPTVHEKRFERAGSTRSRRSRSVPGRSGMRKLRALIDGLANGPS